MIMKYQITDSVTSQTSVTSLCAYCLGLCSNPVTRH